MSESDLALRAIGGFRLSRAVWLAARLRLADLVGDGAASAGELAAASEADTDAVERLMRALAAFGVFRRDDDGRFGQTPASDAAALGPSALAAGVDRVPARRRDVRGVGRDRVRRPHRPAVVRRPPRRLLGRVLPRARRRRRAVRRGDERDHARVRGRPAGRRRRSPRSRSPSTSAAAREACSGGCWSATRTRAACSSTCPR